MNQSQSATARLKSREQQHLNGLVLAGGRSSRMGQDKSLLVYHDMPQREYLFNLLSQYCDQVFTSCNNLQEVPPPLNPLPDRFEIPGPLNGVLSAFAFRPHGSWLVVAVDMPFVNGATLELLVSNRDQTKPATCFYNPDTKQPEPLLTLWEHHAYPALWKFVENGHISPRDFLRSHAAKMIDPPDDKTLSNFNTPQDIIH